MMRRISQQDWENEHMHNPMTEGEALARAQFETWAKSRGRSTNTWVETGEYSHYDTQRCWQAWQAALTAHTAASGGEVVAFIHKDDLDDLRSGRDRKDAPVFSSLAAVSEEFRGGMVPLYTAPPASVPADALERLAEKWREEVGSREGGPTAASVHECADELAALIPKGADHG